MNLLKSNKKNLIFGHCLGFDRNTYTVKKQTEINIQNVFYIVSPEDSPRIFKLYSIFLSNPNCCGAVTIHMFININS